MRGFWKLIRFLCACTKMLYLEIKYIKVFYPYLVDKIAMFLYDFQERGASFKDNEISNSEERGVDYEE